MLLWCLRELPQVQRASIYPAAVGTMSAKLASDEQRSRQTVRLRSAVPHAAELAGAAADAVALDFLGFSAEAAVGDALVFFVVLGLASAASGRARFFASFGGIGAAAVHPQARGERLKRGSVVVRSRVVLSIYLCCRRRN